jgi:hypothetical protein
VVEKVIGGLILEKYELLSGCNSVDSIFAQREVSQWIELYSTWKSSFSTCVGILNTIVKSYFMAGFIIYRRLKNAISSKASYSLNESARDAAQHLIGEKGFYDKQIGEDFDATIVIPMDLISSFTLVSQRYGGFKFATPILFDYFLILNWLYLEAVSPCKIITKQSSFVKTRDWLGGHPATLEMLKRIGFPEGVTDDTISIIHKYIVSGVINTATKDMICRKFKDAILNKGLPIRDTLKAIDACHSGSVTGITNNKIIEDVGLLGLDSFYQDVPSGYENFTSDEISPLEQEFDKVIDKDIAWAQEVLHDDYDDDYESESNEFIDMSLLNDHYNYHDSESDF